MASLDLIACTDTSGVAHDLYSVVKSSWRKAATVLDVLGVKHIPFLDDYERCRQVFSHWIEIDGTDDYPVTWDALCELLEDIGFKDVACKLKQSLPS